MEVAPFRFDFFMDMIKYAEDRGGVTADDDRSRIAAMDEAAFRDVFPQTLSRQGLL